MNILLGITGSIAAYKSALIVRLLIKEGHQVKAIMTDSAKDFITPLTISTLSQNPVLSEFYDKETGSWENHVNLAGWAQLMVIAPCTANTIAQLAQGHCTCLLHAVYLSSKCKIMIAPAMDREMLQHPSVQRNLLTLKQDGVLVLEPEFGELASGLTGFGRMAEPEEIVKKIQSLRS